MNPLIVEEQVVAELRELRLPGISKAFREVGRQARQEGWTQEEYLLELLQVESRGRLDKVAQSRIREAGFPTQKTLDQFDFGAQPEVSRDRLIRLARCEWVKACQAVLLVGPVGTGKTHLGTALGMEAAQRRHRVKFWRAEELVRLLTEARGQGEVTKLMKKLDRYEVLILDELGFIPFDRTGAELLFNVLANRYQRRATVISSNLAFSEWGRVFGDEKLTAALLDRLGEKAEVIATSGSSYRLRRREENKEF
jgi:DNA replication protein DnaC